MPSAIRAYLRAFNPPPMSSTEPPYTGAPREVARDNIMFKLIVSIYKAIPNNIENI